MVITSADWGLIIGLLAGLVSFWGMSRTTMIPLRLGTLVSNLGFIAYGLLTSSWPTLLLHALLFPLNSWRLFQVLKILKIMRSSSSDSFRFELLVDFMSTHEYSSGEYLFRINDPVGSLYIIEEGQVLLEEINIVCGPGEVLGEISMFIQEEGRTASAKALTPIKVSKLSDETAMQIFYQNPQFGFFLTRTIVRRLYDNWQEAEKINHQNTHEKAVKRKSA